MIADYWAGPIAQQVVRDPRFELLRRVARQSAGTTARVTVRGSSGSDDEELPGITRRHHTQPRSGPTYGDVEDGRQPVRVRGLEARDDHRPLLGCMSFGEPKRGNQPWSLGEDDARVIIRRALEAGINFLDTANAYSDGSSEEIVGQALADFSSRDEIVLATKIYFPMRPRTKRRRAVPQGDHERD